LTSSAEDPTVEYASACSRARPEPNEYSYSTHAAVARFCSDRSPIPEQAKTYTTSNRLCDLLDTNPEH
jgi:hypothetical protein